MKAGWPAGADGLGLQGQTAGMCGEAGIKGRWMWQMAEREERRAQAHRVELRRRCRVSRMEQMGWHKLQELGGVQ